MTTPIHRALGRTDSVLDEALFHQACQAGIPEQHDLDWKATNYNGPSDKARLEFAKDTAAMANSGGGWIVLGIKQGANGVAGAVNPLTWDETNETTLRGWAYTCCYPPIIDLEFTAVPATGTPSTDPGEDPQTGAVVVIRIPSMIDRPVFVAPPNEHKYQVPVRRGASTSFLRPNEIERMWQDRYDRLRTEHTRITDLLDENTPAHAASNPRGIVATVVVRPHELRHADTLTRDQVTRAFHELIAYLPAGQQSALRLLDRDPIRGFRRWRTMGNPDHSAAAHDDGTVTITSSFPLWPQFAHVVLVPDGYVLGDSDLGADLLVDFIHSAIATTSALARRWDYAGRYQAVLRLSWPVDTKARIHASDGQSVPGSQRTMYLFNTITMDRWIDIDVDYAPGDATSRDAAADRMIVDALNQAGLTHYAQISNS